MKHTLSVIALAFAAACSSQESPAPASGPASATNAADAGADPDVSTVPTQDEADAAAKGSIDAKNADAEFDKLKKDIEGGG
jgi:membrane-bound lytic murein transglycosylase B